mmetsp:Transcript_46080/g.84558  ORF Transcript_46080/g.84558 Transcript_46080/m.84558 type:complete len:222 (+) Transcript_46080:903-1568(+)
MELTPAPFSRSICKASTSPVLAALIACFIRSSGASADNLNAAVLAAGSAPAPVGEPAVDVLLRRPEVDLDFLTTLVFGFATSLFSSSARSTSDFATPTLASAACSTSGFANSFLLSAAFGVVGVAETMMMSSKSSSSRIVAIASLLPFVSSVSCDLLSLFAACTVCSANSKVRGSTPRMAPNGSNASNASTSRSSCDSSNSLRTSSAISSLSSGPMLGIFS